MPRRKQARVILALIVGLGLIAGIAGAKWLTARDRRETSARNFLLQRRTTLEQRTAALRDAAQAGNVTEAVMLMNRGADASGLPGDPQGLSPLALAVSRHDVPMVKALLSHGAAVRAPVRLLSANLPPRDPVRLLIEEALKPYVSRGSLRGYSGRTQRDHEGSLGGGYPGRTQPGYLGGSKSLTVHQGRTVDGFRNRSASEN